MCVCMQCVHGMYISIIAIKTIFIYIIPLNLKPMLDLTIMKLKFNPFIFHFQCQFNWPV